MRRTTFSGPVPIRARVALVAVFVAAAAAAQVPVHAGIAPADPAAETTVDPGLGTVAFAGAYADDGFIDAAEAAAADPGGRPVDWITPGPDAVSAEGRFTDATDATIAGGNCGPFALGASGQGYLNLSCMAAASALQSDPEAPVEVRWQVRWLDAVGDSSAWASASILVDTLEAAPVITQPADGAKVATLVELAGTALPGRAIEISEGPASLGTATAGETGAWTFQTTRAAGAHSLTASSTDNAGNTASDVVNVTVDLSVPVITAPANGSLHPAAVVVVGNVGTPGVPVEVFEGSALIARGPADARGIFQIDAGFATGTHTIRARSKGTSPSDLSAPRTFRVDAGVPTVTVTNKSPSLFPYEFEGTAGDNVGVAGIELRFFNDSGAMIGVEMADCETCGPAATSVEWTGDRLAGAPGIKTVQVRAVDGAGQRSSAVSVLYVG